MKIPPVRTTALDIDLSDEERKQFAEQHRKEWFSRTLDRLWFMALSDAEMKQAFLDKAKSLAKKRSSRSLSAMYLLLVDYASAVEEFDGDKERVIDKLIQENKRSYGTIISPRTIDNRVSKAIGMAREGKLPELSERDREIIESRTARYKHSRK